MEGQRYFSQGKTPQIWLVSNCVQIVFLIPRPFHHPVFDLLQYAKMEGESLVHFITRMTSCLPGRQRGGRGLQSKECILHTGSLFLNQEWYIFRFSNVRNSST